MALSTKIFFENYCDEPLYIFLRTVNGTLEIHVFDEPIPMAAPVPPMRRIDFAVTDQIRACINNGSLSYMLVGHNRRLHVAFSPGRNRLPEGPIFAIEPVKA